MLSPVGTDVVEMDVPHELSEDTWHHVSPGAQLLLPIYSAGILIPPDGILGYCRPPLWTLTQTRSISLAVGAGGGLVQAHFLCLEGALVPSGGSRVPASTRIAPLLCTRALCHIVLK